MRGQRGYTSQKTLEFYLEFPRPGKNVILKMHENGEKISRYQKKNIHTWSLILLRTAIAHLNKVENNAWLYQLVSSVMNLLSDFYCIYF